MQPSPHNIRLHPITTPNDYTPLSVLLYAKKLANYVPSPIPHSCHNNTKPTLLSLVFSIFHQKSYFPTTVPLGGSLYVRH